MSIAMLCCSYFQKYNNLDLIIDDKSYLVALLQGIFLYKWRNDYEKHSENV